MAGKAWGTNQHAKPLVDCGVGDRALDVYSNGITFQGKDELAARLNPQVFADGCRYNHLAFV